jgi:DNA-binding transcriptional LysR family regulator
MDYNLFPVFVEIMKHRNISKAAKALNITQPAASNSLARLRHQFGDPLFIRTSHGVMPTQLATDIAEKMEYHVEQLIALTQTKNQKEIDLSLINKTIKVTTQDMEEYLILPALVSTLEKIAPNLQLEIKPYNRSVFVKELATNQVDIVISYLRDIHKNLISQKLFSQDFVCICRKGHPYTKLDLSLTDYTNMRHVLVSPDKGGFKGLVDDKLKHLGLSRRVAVSTPHFSAGCQFVANSDYFLTLPRYIAARAITSLDLKLYELPFHLESFATSIHWHRRLDHDPEHKAIRSLIIDIVKHELTKLRSSVANPS